MKRTTTLLAAFLLTTVTMTGTATAAACGTTCDTTPPPHGVRTAPPAVPLCVTTTWRAAHTHHRKTRPGEVCVLTPTMWLPHSWTVLAYLGHGDLLAQRPVMTEEQNIGRSS